MNDNIKIIKEIIPAVDLALEAAKQSIDQAQRMLHEMRLLITPNDGPLLKFDPDGSRTHNEPPEVFK